MTSKNFPVILCSVSSKVEETLGIEYYFLFKNYVKNLIRHGAVVLMVPEAPNNQITQLVNMADGLVITGGSAVYPPNYGEKMQDYCGRIDIPRDDVELNLLKEFIKQKKPCLGICRGMGIINAYFGGTLVQDIKEVLDENHPCPSFHHIRIEQESFLGKMFPQEIYVNSFHHQASAKIGTGLKVVAWDDSGKVPEALEHQTLPIWAVQWHPERMSGIDRLTKEGECMDVLLEEFVNLCQKK